MSRPLSDNAIEYRVLVAYHRAQALARNCEYCSHVMQLYEGFETADGTRVRGLRFDRQGFLDDPPWGESRTLYDEIRARSGLYEPMLPDALKALSFADLNSWDQDLPIFDDLPGWRLEPKDREAARRAARADRPIRRRDFKRIAVPLRRLGQRHRDVRHAYPLYWQVFDLRAAGKTDTEIARTLWPGVLETDPDDGRQRVYDYLDRARTIIARAYAVQGPQKERRHRRDDRPAE